MAFSELPEREKQLIQECMVAIMQGPFLDEEEFHSRTGITRAELASVLAQWPEINDEMSESVEVLAINNCCNEILYGVYISPQQWAQWFSGTLPELSETYQHWAYLKGHTATGIM